MLRHIVIQISQLPLFKHIRNRIISKYSLNNFAINYQYAIFQLNTIQTVTSHPVSLCKTKMYFNQRPYFKHIRNRIISKCSTEHSWYKLSVYAIFQLNVIPKVISHSVSLCKAKLCLFRLHKFFLISVLYLKNLNLLNSC